MHTSIRSPATPADRRKNPRCTVDILMNHFRHGQPYLGRAVDISQTGMRLLPVSRGGLPARFVGLQFQLPGCEEVLTAAGEIVTGSAEEAPVGIRFTRMPPASSQKIAQYLAARMSPPR